MNSETGPPQQRRRFYSIMQQPDGTADVYLDARVYPMATPDGMTDYDVSVRVVRGVVPWDGLEEDIRARYDAWRESGEMIYL